MEIKLDIFTTEVGKSYWNRNGKYQADYDKLYDTLVPASGMTDTLFGEVVRAVSRLSYEYYNNGNGNACERNEIEGEWVECPYCHGSGTCEDDVEEYECPECGGEGGYYEEGEWEKEINPFFGKFIRLLREFFEVEMPKASRLMDEIENIILKDDYTFSVEEEYPYVLMTDVVIYIIRSKAYKLEWAIERSPEIPEWYKREE